MTSIQIRGNRIRCRSCGDIGMTTREFMTLIKWMQRNAKEMGMADSLFFDTTRDKVETKGEKK